MSLHNAVLHPSVEDIGLRSDVETGESNRELKKFTVDTECPASQRSHFEKALTVCLASVNNLEFLYNI